MMHIHGFSLNWRRGESSKWRAFGIDGVPIIKGAGMTLQDLKKLPCFEYKQGDEEVSSATTPTILDCAVCLDNFKVGDSCRMLPNCHHYFHVHCVDAWLIKTPFCPICRSYTKMMSKVISPRIGRAENNPAPIVLDEFV